MQTLFGGVKDKTFAFWERAQVSDPVSPSPSDNECDLRV